MSDEHKWRRKCFVICLLALFIGLMGIVLPEQFDIAYQPVVNNTDLYNNGRITGVNYTASNYSIDLYLIFHVVGTGSPISVDSNLSVNGTVLQDRDYHTTAGAGIHEHFPLSATIPKGAVYNVTNSSGIYTIEWREYPILTGANGTLSVNITQGGGTGSQNLSQVLTQGNDANNQSIVKLRRLDMNITNGSYSTFTMLGSSSTPFFVAYENNTMRHEITYGGTQIWRLRGGDSAPAEVGYIAYTTPASNPGIAFFNASVVKRSDIRSTTDGLILTSFSSTDTAGSPTTFMVNRTHNIEVGSPSLPGKGITMISPNGSPYCITVNNAGTVTSTAGYCT